MPAEADAKEEDDLMLLPRKTKYRKAHRGRRRGEAKGQSTVQFGDYGIKALQDGWITNRQIEAARIAMTRKIKRGGKVWINVFPDKPYTKKPAETRMGKGKGSPGGLGRRGQARPGHVRARRRARGARQGGASPRGPEAADQDEVRATGELISLKAKDLQELNDDQLVERLAETRKELFNLRFQSATGALEDTTRLKLRSARSPAS